MESYSVTIHMKAIKQYLAVYYAVQGGCNFLTFESVDEILKCDHSMEATEQ